MSDTSSFKGRTVIYSNRPPTSGASGGAQAVIEAAHPSIWIGPESVSDERWNAMSDDERTALSTHAGNGTYEVKTFPAPKSLTEHQYKTISNEILWPIAHSIQPKTDKTIEEIEEAYFGGYLSHNELGNVALRKLSKEEGLTADDRIWVHDYQCDNVPGTLYSRHIPWPSVDFLESVTFKTRNGMDAPLLQTSFYRDFIEHTSGRALSTFQRPIDQANFIMTAAYVAGDPELFSLESTLPALQNLTQDVRDPKKRPAIEEALMSEIGIGAISRLKLFGANTCLMNVPVGQVTEETYKTAVENEHKLDKTKFSLKPDGKFNIFDVDLGNLNHDHVNLTVSNPADFSAENPPTLADLIEPIRGRDWILSVHRNDYTKGTTTKLQAAKKVLEKNPNATFLFILQPTREDVGGYRLYAQQVYQNACYLKSRFGDNRVVIIPEGVHHDDVLGLMRQPEMRGFMGLGHKDGHDLTVREVVDANDKDSAIGVITSSGIGAADVLGHPKNAGSFVIRNPENADEVADALREILNPANTEQLKARFNHMKARSQRYDAANFTRMVDNAYEPAMAHRLGKEWKESFQQPEGDIIDRNGSRSDPNEEKPNYIVEILKGIKGAVSGVSR